MHSLLVANGWYDIYIKSVLLDYGEIVPAITDTIGNLTTTFAGHLLFNIGKIPSAVQDFVSKLNYAPSIIAAILGGILDFLGNTANVLARAVGGEPILGKFLILLLPPL